MMYIHLKGGEPVRLRGAYAISLFLVYTCLGARSTDKIVIEGYVRNEAGQTIKGIHIYLTAGGVVTQGRTYVIPFDTGRAVGAVISHDPNEAQYHQTHGLQSTSTDQNGHYQFKVDTGYVYTLYASNKKGQANARASGRKALKGVTELLGSVSINVGSADVKLISQDITAKRAN